MYSTGELVIHHKKGARKYYDLAEKHVPEALRGAADPAPGEDAHHAWRVLRRISAVGLLWNKASDAYIDIWGLKAAQRTRAIDSLLDEARILPVQVEGIKDVLYARQEDSFLLASAAAGGMDCKPRCELIAPLDCLLWDRKLIQALFGFAYKWEIYEPAHKRKYGYYVLPLLYGERFVGRVEAVADNKSHALIIKNVWPEAEVRQTKQLDAALGRCLRRFARFNGCPMVIT